MKKRLQENNPENFKGILMMALALMGLLAYRCFNQRSFNRLGRRKG